MLRVLFHGSRSIPEIPHPTRDGAGGSIAELHGEIVVSGCRIEGEVSDRCRMLNIDAVEAGAGVFSTGADDCQCDGEKPDFGVSVSRVLLGRALTISKVPDPLIDGTGGKITELDRQSGSPGVR